MAGLLAARVLSDFYREVVILERDGLPDTGKHRRGVPQARHAHAILASGLETLEELFPGIYEDLISRGALCGDPLKDGRWFFEGNDLARSPTGTRSILSSRTLLEDCVRSHVRAIDGISVLEQSSVRDLITEGGTVKGVCTDTEALKAELVVDASGRGSRAPRWLASMGFPEPAEERVEVRLAYTTRIFQRRSRHMNGDVFAVIPQTPEGKRGGVVLAQEDDRWIVTLFGFFGEKAPEEMEGYMEFARSLPAPYIYDLLRDSEPLGEAVTYSFPASVRRRYEKLSRFPDGFLVFGDAICSFNPAFGQGMSVAALQAKALRKTLDGDARNIARRFFRDAAKLIDVPWNIAVGADLKMPETAGPRSLSVKLINWYISNLHMQAHTDLSAAIAFNRVTQLLDSPSTLMRPGLIGRVLLGTLRRRIRTAAGAREKLLNTIDTVHQTSSDRF